MVAQLLRLDAVGDTAKQSQAVGQWLVHMARVRRAEFHSQRLAIERERLELQRKKTKQEMEEEFWKWAAQDHIRSQIAQSYCLTPDERRREARRILGLPPLPEKIPSNRAPEPPAPNEPAKPNQGRQ